MHSTWVGKTLIFCQGNSCPMIFICLLHFPPLSGRISGKAFIPCQFTSCVKLFEILDWIENLRSFLGYILKFLRCFILKKESEILRGKVSLHFWGYVWILIEIFIHWEWDTMETEWCHSMFLAKILLILVSQTFCTFLFYQWKVKRGNFIG